MGLFFGGKYHEIKSKELRKKSRIMVGKSNALHELNIFVLKSYIILAFLEYIKFYYSHIIYI